MPIVRYEDISDYGKDVLREIGSIGTGNAATSISSILGCDVSISLPDIQILGFSEAVSFLGDPEEPIIAVVTEMKGGITGLMMFLMRIDFAKTMIKALAGIEIEDYNDIDDYSTSVITEIGNILISSYISSLSSFTDLDVNLSVPAIAVNMLGGVIDAPVAEIGHETNKLMLISGRFIIGNEQHESNLLLIPSVKSLGAILERFGAV